MSNTVYAKAKQALLEGDLDLTGQTLRLLFIKKSLYTQNFSTNQYVSDIPSSAIVFRTTNITGVTAQNGTLDAVDVVEDSYPGMEFDAIVLYQVGSSDADSRLIFFIDESEGLPFTGVNESLLLTLKWNNESGKILSL
jgi:hypothetical protein